MFGVGLGSVRPHKVMKVSSWWGEHVRSSAQNALAVTYGAACIALRCHPLSATLGARTRSGQLQRNSISLNPSSI